jgi:hypothetical protein
MTLNLFFIPVINIELKRLFLFYKIIVIDRRNKLLIKVIEALECLRSWHKVKAFELKEEIIE